MTLDVGKRRLAARSRFRNTVDPDDRLALLPRRRARAAELRDRSRPAEGLLGRSRSESRAHGPHRAHFLHFEIGYELALPGSPNLVFQYDLASGDEDPNDSRNERFDTLFGDRSFEFGPTGLYGTVARANLRSPGVRVTFRPHARVRSVVSYRRVWLDEPRDEWAGSDYRDTTGASGRSVGRHLEASITWSAIDDRLQVDGGIARLAAGSFPASIARPAFHGNPATSISAPPRRSDPV